MDIVTIIKNGSVRMDTDGELTIVVEVPEWVGDWIRLRNNPIMLIGYGSAGKNEPTTMHFKEFTRKPEENGGPDPDYSI